MDPPCNGVSSEICKKFNFTEFVTREYDSERGAVAEEVEESTKRVCAALEEEGRGQEEETEEEEEGMWRREVVPIIKVCFRTVVFGLAVLGSTRFHFFFGTF
jgi:hypothetical protein